MAALNTGYLRSFHFVIVIRYRTFLHTLPAVFTGDIIGIYVIVHDVKDRLKR